MKGHVMFSFLWCKHDTTASASGYTKLQAATINFFQETWDEVSGQL